MSSSPISSSSSERADRRRRSPPMLDVRCAVDFVLGIGHAEGARLPAARARTASCRSRRRPARTSRCASHGVTIASGEVVIVDDTHGAAHQPGDAAGRRGGRVSLIGAAGRAGVTFGAEPVMPGGRALLVVSLVIGAAGAGGLAAAARTRRRGARRQAVTVETAVSLGERRSLVIVGRRRPAAAAGAHAGQRLARHRARHVVRRHPDRPSIDGVARRRARSE